MRFLIVAVVALGIAGLLFLTRSETQADLRKASPQMVDTITVEQRDIRHVRQVAGKLQPSHTVSLRFEVAGRVKHRRVEPGQKVSAGQPLLEVDNDDYLDAVSESRALLQQEISAIERDRALLELEEKETASLERELRRMEELERRSLTSQSSYDQSEQKLLRQQAEVARLQHSVATATVRRTQKESALKRAQRNLERTGLISPVDAVVNRVLLEEGDYAMPGQHAIDLVQVRELDVYLEIPGSLAENLALDQIVELSVDGKHFSGVIVALAPDPDPDTNTHSLRVRVDGAALYPGKIVQVALPGRLHARAKVIPATATVNEGEGSYVFKIRQGRLFRQPVEILAQYDDLRIVEGVDVGELIVERNVSAYTDGQEVVVRSP